MESGTATGEDREAGRVLIVGGGVAGLEAALALGHLAPGVDVTLTAPDPDFFYKPLVVDEPFTGEPARQYALEPLLERAGTSLVPGSIGSVDPGAHEVRLEDGDCLPYDALLLCVGGRPRPVYPTARTFWAGSSDLDVDDLIDEAIGTLGQRLHLVLPDGVVWPLPLYELALMIRGRADSTGRRKLHIRVHTPEQGPLMVFGRVASDAVAELLSERRIDVLTETHVIDEAGIASERTLGEPLPERSPVLALPVIDGPAIPGLPADPRGFLPVDGHCRVRGVTDVYAAGDCTDFPIKQGGLATQEADAAAEHIAARLGGADLTPTRFRPVLRGKLFTDAESLSMVARIAGGGGESQASFESLWWPPAKIAGRYLSVALENQRQLPDLDPEIRPLEVEVSWPHEWHGEPLLSELRPPE